MHVCLRLVEFVQCVQQRVRGNLIHSAVERHGRRSQGQGAGGLLSEARTAASPEAADAKHRNRVPCGHFESQLNLERLRSRDRDETWPEKDGLPSGA